MDVQHITIGPDSEGQRIDNFLVRTLKGLPKSRIYRMLRSGEVRVDGGRIKAEHRLVPGEVVRVPPVRLAEKPVELPIAEASIDRLAAQVPVLYEQDGLLVVNKPAGLAVHGGSGVKLGLIEMMRRARRLPELELVHRLDRDTSGLLMLASRRRSLLSLHAQLREGQMRKRYLAVVLGDGRRRLDNRSDLIRLPLLKTRSANGERWVRVDDSGQDSMTRIRCLSVAEHDRLGTLSLLQCEPLTGRTHQIRVHAQSLGLPILGDPKYGDDEANRLASQQGLRRMMLHAWRLELDSTAAEGEAQGRLQLEASWDREFGLALQAAGGQS